MTDSKAIFFWNDGLPGNIPSSQQILIHISECNLK